MSACKKCGADEVLFGHQGLCKTHYDAYMAHQKELRDISIQNRELLAARIVHPAGKSPRQRARDLWVQKPYETHGHQTYVGEDM